MDELNDSAYRVLLNGEEQYSIWPADRPNPPGWRDAGFEGVKSACLAYVQEAWTDMRPASLRHGTVAPASVYDKVGE
jgi:MbtH protein